ncbi:hypothetical protein ARMSODRAFT_973471 [Armillaria solidipes]|uniref:Uncharacterized protein n=1 Tax=Armillaria solidipes TaxID=1076256 RepID=A0A2H3BM34_9AGAR|nr:hypothetical protein ARMSODRAFT_973471 [Armillaria solidipes]
MSGKNGGVDAQDTANDGICNISVIRSPGKILAVQISNLETTAIQLPRRVSSLSTNVADMGLVRIVAGLFKVSESAVQQEIDQMKSIDTDKAVLMDLKVYLKNINAGVPFPGHSYRALYERGDVLLGCIPQRLQKSGQQRTQGFFLLHLHYHTERLSDIYGNLFNVVLPSLYHVMDALVRPEPSEIEPYLTVLDAQVVHGRARQSSYHVANCFDIRCARRPIRRHTLAKGPVPYLVLNAPASTEFYQEGIGSLQKARGDGHDRVKGVPGGGDDLDEVLLKDVIPSFEAYMMTPTVYV